MTPFPTFLLSVLDTEVDHIARINLRIGRGMRPYNPVQLTLSEEGISSAYEVFRYWHAWRIFGERFRVPFRQFKRGYCVRSMKIFRYADGGNSIQTARRVGSCRLEAKDDAPNHLVLEFEFNSILVVAAGRSRTKQNVVRSQVFLKQLVFEAWSAHVQEARIVTTIQF